MKSGASSSQQDFTDFFLDSYTAEEHKKFQAILKAVLDEKNTSLASELRSKLSDEEKKKIRVYIKDWGKVDLKKLNARKEQCAKNIKNMDQQLNDLDKTIVQMEEKKKELFQNYGRDMAANLTKTPKSIPRSEPVTTKSTISSIFNKFKH